MKYELRQLAKFPKEICWLGNPILRETAKKVTTAEIQSGEAKRIIADLTKVLKKIQKMGKGVAIAAPQICISKAVAVICWQGSYIAFINPVITNTSRNKNAYPEGCLSSLPLVAEVVRPAEIDVVYLDKSGDEKKEHFEGKLARMLQHEIDHLNGVLFIDRADLKKSQFVADFENYKNTAKLVDL